MPRQVLPADRRGELGARDLLALDPRFDDAHGFKIAAMPTTFSFPTRPGGGLFLGPRIWVGLAIALGAALLQLAIG